jgi:hypothetical protein
MTTSVVSMKVKCPNCQIDYVHRYLPERALPELNAVKYGKFGECMVASCPSCDHQINVVVELTGSDDPGKQISK